jgi:magnesium chelatase subunit I
VGKTTAVRGLLDIMPEVPYEFEDSEGNVRTLNSPMRLLELPLNARIEDVVGTINERVALEQQRAVLEEGVLAKAHRSLLYADEINLLEPRVIDVILDAAAQGQTMVRRGAMTRLFASRFILVGSMNPEEGSLRPQIMDRFGLRVWVSPLADTTERLEIYRRSREFREEPANFRARFAAQTEALRDEVAIAREILPHVTIPPEIEALTLAVIQELKIPSHRAEIALLEAARARAAADFRSKVIVEDVERIAPLALRQRRSSMLEEYANQIHREDEGILAMLQKIVAAGGTEGLPVSLDQEAAAETEDTQSPAPSAPAEQAEQPQPHSSTIRAIEDE